MKSKSSESGTLEKVWEDIRKSKQITDKNMSLLETIFGKRVKTALNAVNEMRVMKYVFKPSQRVTWIVRGKAKNYQIIPAANFCTCDDFYFRVMDHEVHLCYHLLAQKFAEAVDKYKVLEEEDKNFEMYMKKWKEVKIKRVLSPEEVEKIRKASIEVLSNRGKIKIGQLKDALTARGFNLTNKHLAVILKADPKKRFKYREGEWALK